MSYSQDEKSTGLDALTTLDSLDLFIVGDVSDSGRAKKITKDDVLETLGINDIIDDITDIQGDITTIEGDIVNLQTQIDNLGGGGGGGTAGKPLSFQYSNSFTGADVIVSTYTDREAMIYTGASSLATTLYVQDAIGYIQSRDMTVDDAAIVSINSVVILNGKLYVLITVAANAHKVYSYDLANLSAGGALCTFSGQTLGATGAMNMTSDGTLFYFNYAARNSASPEAISNYSLSGTTFTFGTTVTMTGGTTYFTEPFVVTETGEYVAFNVSTNLVKKWSNAGSVNYTSGSFNFRLNPGGLRIINWSDTVYYLNKDASTSNEYMEFVKMYIPSTTLSEEGITTLKVTLSSAELLDLNGTPKQLVAAPGAGKVIQVLGVIGNMDFITAAYATNTAVDIIYAGEADDIFRNTTLLPSAADLISTFAVGSNTTLKANTALQATNLVGDPTAGSGTLDLYVTYQIVTL